MHCKTPLFVYFLNFWILVFILNLSTSGKNINFIQHPIDLDFDGIHRIIAFDLDKDGDIDIIGGSEITPTTASKGLAWWRNEGNNSWTRFTISTNFIHIMSVDTAEIDGDSFVDVVASSWSLHQIAWLKNSGDPTQNWTKHIIKYGITNAHDAKCADFDNDGDKDVVAVSSTPGRIFICYNDGTLNNWSSSTVTNSFGGALSVLAFDLDKDNYTDIIGSASNANQIAWWKNNSGSPINWTKKLVATNFVGAAGIRIADLNGDSLNDIFATAWKSNQVAYWLCNDIQNNSWTKYTVSSQLDTASDLELSDFDQDGDLDIVAVGKIPGELVLYENNNFGWNKIQISGDFYGGSALEVIDLDKDGDDDIIAGASYLGELYWWENTSISSIPKNPEATTTWKNNLFQNFPNPFNQNTKIDFIISKPTHILLKIYDINGHLVKTLENRIISSGKHSYIWNSKNDSGNHVSSGLYFYKLIMPQKIESRKMLVLR